MRGSAEKREKAYSILKRRVCSKSNHAIFFWQNEDSQVPIHELNFHQNVTISSSLDNNMNVRMPRKGYLNTVNKT